jgi:hypothetical protein
MPVTHSLLSSLGSSLLQLPSLVKQPCQNYFQASIAEFLGGIFALLKNNKTVFPNDAPAESGRRTGFAPNNPLMTAFAQH